MSWQKWQKSTRLKKMQYMLLKVQVNEKVKIEIETEICILKRMLCTQVFKLTMM